MSDIASLIIRVATEGADRASTELDGLGGAAIKAAGAIGGLAAATSVFNKLIDSQRNFDQLNAGLITMTGSAANAAEAFGALQQFAATTPFDLDQAVKGFTQLVALGLNPSQEALTSFGNTAAAMGKDLNQMIEAVADAATGEFERLKEFGIKASQQGDQVSFTFRGVTTTVKKSADDIQKYLINIGNTDFAGAMQERANTLDGALSNLDDSWAALVLSIARSGFGDAVREQVEVAATQIGNLTALIASGELVSSVEAWKTQFDSSFSFISDWLNQLNNDVADTANEISPFGKDVADEIGAGFDTLPAMVSAVIQDVYAQLSSLVDQAMAVAEAIKGALNPLSFSGWADKFQEDLKTNQDLLIQQQKVIYDTRDQIVGAYKDEIEMSKKQRAEYDKNKAARVDLGKYGITPQESGTSGQSDKEKKAAEAAAKKLAKEKEYAAASLNQLRQDNLDELGLIDAKEQEKITRFAGYREKELISQAQFEAAKTEIEINASNARSDEYLKAVKNEKQRQDELDSFSESLLMMNDIELQNIDIQQNAKEDKAKEFYNQGRITEEEYQASLAQIQKGYNKKRVTEYSSMLGDTTDNLRTALGEGNKMYKAFAIANAIMNTYQGAVAAFQSAAAIPIVGWIAAPIAAGAAIAAGLANVAKIRSAREQGGALSAGQASTIAERGKAEVIMPAGASRVRTADQMRKIMGDSSSNSGTPNVTIVNNTTGRIDSAVTEKDDEGRLRVIIDEHVSNALQNSNSNISKSRRATRNQPGY